MTLFMTATLLLTTGCKNDETTATKVKIAGFPLFAEACKSAKPTDNVIVSPLSITEMLAMLANGASGETQKQIMDVMDMDASSAEKASETLQMINNYLPSADKETRVSIANSLWIDKTFKLHNDYVKANEDMLGAEVFNQKLSTEATMKDVNTWCDKNTEGCIDKILDQPLPPEMKLGVINALYFKGPWQNKFDKENTADSLFTNADGSKSMVKMMFQSEEFPVWHDDKIAVVSFPYGNGRYCMDVILPNEGESLDSCLKDLSKERMDSIHQKMNPFEINVSMPRMEMKCTLSLNETLKAIGMKDAFNDKTADFSRIADSPLKVSDVKQVVYIKVDEEGTEVAAVSEEWAELSACIPFEFNMNRPFAFIIRERLTGVVLFIGRIVCLKE